LGGPTSKVRGGDSEEGRRVGEGTGGEGKGNGHEPPPQYLEEVYAYEHCI